MRVRVNGKSQKVMREPERVCFLFVSSKQVCVCVLESKRREQEKKSMFYNPEEMT